jgi:TolA-binding protein
MRPIKTLVFALALLPLGLFAADKKMAPPPPTFSFEASTDTAGVQAQPATPDQSVPQDATATAADAQLFGSGAPGSDDSALPAAPSISDEELISNSMEVAYQFYHAEDFVGASQACQQIVDRYPKKDILGTRYLLALCEEHNRTYPDALRQYAYIIKHQPKSTFANAAAFRIGLCHLALGRTEEAIRTFRDIIDFNPQSEYRLQAFIHLGNVYRSEGTWRQAEVIYKDMIRLYPCTSWSAMADQYLAEAYAHQGEDSAAIRVYRLMQDDNGCVPLVMRAQAQLKIGDIQMAEREYQDALQTYKTAIRVYGDVPGIEVYSEERIELARDGRSSSATLESRGRVVNMREAVSQ